MVFKKSIIEAGLKELDALVVQLNRYQDLRPDIDLPAGCGIWDSETCERLLRDDNYGIRPIHILNCGIG